MEAGLRPPNTKSRERRTCLHLSSMRNQAGRTSSVRYEITRKESFYSSEWYEESSRRNTSVMYEVTRGELVHVCPVRGIKQVGLRRCVTKSRDRRAHPRLSGTRNQASGTSFDRYVIVRKEGKSSSIRYEKSSKQDFVRLVQSHVKEVLVLVHLVRGIKQAAVRPSGTKSRERRACPRPSGNRNQAGGTSSIMYEVVRMEGLPSSVRYEKLSTLDFVCLV